MKRSQVDDARGDGSCAVARAEPADPRNCKANGAFAEGKPDDSVLSWTRPRNGKSISSISPTTDRRTLADIRGLIVERICNDQKLNSLLRMFFYSMHRLQHSGGARLRRQEPGGSGYLHCRSLQRGHRAGDVWGCSSSSNSRCCVAVIHPEPQNSPTGHSMGDLAMTYPR
jgi:hypothetical protein